MKFILCAVFIQFIAVHAGRRNFPLRNILNLLRQKTDDVAVENDKDVPFEDLLASDRSIRRPFHLNIQTSDAPDPVFQFLASDLGLSYAAPAGKEQFAEPRNNKINEVLVIVAKDPVNNLKKSKPWDVKNLLSYNDQEENQNDASELFDNFQAQRYDGTTHDFRRRNKSKKKRKKRKKGSKETTSSESSSSESTSSSTSDEKNPGNPFTIHKDKYRQNWIWDHVMSGDHMNVNPHAPKFQSAGPSGPQLFFGRKWWYYNQDDYKPMGRRR